MSAFARTQLLSTWTWGAFARTHLVRADAPCAHGRLTAIAPTQLAFVPDALCPRGRWTAPALTPLVRTDAAHVRADAGVRLRGLTCARTDVGWRPRGHTCVHADASVLCRGNFITDAIVRPSHGRLSGHRPTIRPSVRYCPRDNPGLDVDSWESLIGASGK
jgi:hypothetical protein